MKPAVIVVQVGDSASFRCVFDEKNKLFTVECTPLLLSLSPQIILFSPTSLPTALNSKNEKCLTGSIAGNMHGLEISLHPVTSGDFLLCLTDGFLDHLTRNKHATMESLVPTLSVLVGELLMQILRKVAAAEDEEGRKVPLGLLFNGFMEYTQSVADEKLKSEDIRECDLDDASCIALLVPFFAVPKSGNAYYFFKPVAPPIHPPKRPFGDVIKTIFAGKSLRQSEQEE